MKARNYGEKKMKKLFIVVFPMMLASNVLAVELVCKGWPTKYQNQKPIYVDCSNRKEVIDTLGRAWQSVKGQHIGVSDENDCWQPYQKAKDLNPRIQIDGIANSLFMQCNIALKNVK